MIDILLLLGLAILLGLGGGKSGKKLGSPLVVGYILIGVILGASVLGMFQPDLVDKLDVINYIALALIGFDIGGELSLDVLKKLGKSVGCITLLESFGAFAWVTLAVLLLTRKLYIALIFGALACATAPAATVDVLREYKTAGPLTSTVFAVVALDDAIAIIIYGFASAFAKMSISGYEQISFITIMSTPLMEIGGAILLGIIMGVMLGYVTRQTHDRNELLILSLGGILICTGLANMFHFSLILANMAMGMTLINLPFTDKRTFDVMSSISPPIYILFFVLIGARLRIDLLPVMGVLGLTYILFRTTGKSIGSFLGARVSGAEEVVAKYLGFCLFSQAGVAIGLAIQAWHEFQAYGVEGYQLGLLAVNVIAATTLIFQVIGPILTKLAVVRAGEVGRHA